MTVSVLFLFEVSSAWPWVSSSLSSNSLFSTFLSSSCWRVQWWFVLDWSRFGVLVEVLVCYVLGSLRGILLWACDGVESTLGKPRTNFLKKIKFDKKVWKLDPRPPTPPWKSTLLKKCGFGVDPPRPSVEKIHTFYFFFFWRLPWDESQDRYPHDQTCETNTHSLTSFNDKGASDK